MTELLNEKEVAEILRLSPATILNWRVRKVGPDFLKLPNGSIRYEKETLEKWLRAS